MKDNEGRTIVYLTKKEITLFNEAQRRARRGLDSALSMPHQKAECPHPERIEDEATGQMVINKEYLAWWGGHNQGFKEVNDKLARLVREYRLLVGYTGNAYIDNYTAGRLWEMTRQVFAEAEKEV